MREAKKTKNKRQQRTKQKKEKIMATYGGRPKKQQNKIKNNGNLWRSTNILFCFVSFYRVLPTSQNKQQSPLTSYFQWIAIYDVTPSHTSRGSLLLHTVLWLGLWTLNLLPILATNKKVI